MTTLRNYDRSFLSRDVIAGLTLWGMVVPEGIAYAGLAGLPAQAGLYTLLVTMLAYALFGSSKHLVVVATSATAALVGGTVAALQPMDATQYAQYAAALVVLVGVLFLLAGLAKLGFIAQFLSQPVMEGFVFGLALFVGVGQLNKLFGVDKGSGNVLEKLWHVITELDNANWWDFLVGVVALALLFGLPMLSKKIPAGLVVLGLGIGLSMLFDLAGNHGVDIVGELPKGLPSVGLPDVGLSSLWILLPSAAGIVLVAYSEALGVAQSFAQRHGYDIDANKELRAHGVANVASGLLGGLVAAGGMSSSAVNEGAGARSQMSGVVATAMALVTVLVLTPLFTDLPEAVLGALVLHAVSHMLKWRSLQRVWRMSRLEFWPAIAAVLGVVLIDVLQGLIIAVVLSLLLVVYRSSRPAVVALGALPQRTDMYVAVSRNPDAIVDREVLVVRLDAAMYYANSVPNRDVVKALVRASAGVRAVVVDVEVQHDLDLTTMETLEQLVDWARAQHVDVYFAAVHADLRQRLDETGLTDHVGADRLHATVAAAVEAARRSGSPGPQAG
jgi:high affinity sulfate transporter 1